MTLAEARGVEVVLSGRRVLSGLSLYVEESSILAVVGPNGAGKTTLLRVFAGLVEPTAGEVTVAGRRLHGMPPRERARLVAYAPPLPPGRGLGQTVEEFVASSLYPSTGLLGASGPGEAEKREARRVLRLLDAEALAQRRLWELSSGEAQRAMLAHALARGARLLLVDEPTSFQDVRGRLLVYRALRSAAEAGAAVVVATHDFTLASMHADRVAVLAGGRLVAQGAPGEVLTPVLIEEVFRVRAGTVETRWGRLLVPLEPL